VTGERLDLSFQMRMVSMPHTMPPPNSAPQMAPLLAWYRRNARDLPWRRTSDPYAVLISEFMAQQTQISTVIGAYERWMKRFPTVQALASADETEVLAMWQGLGYYSRARNLHRAAKAVVERHGGKIPADLDALMALPGIGAYTAGAVMAFAFDRPAAVVDTNVARVLTRLRAITEPIDSTVGRRLVQEAAMDLQPQGGGARELNSALMELGALVCKPRRPDCPGCPIRGGCAAPNPELLPVKRERAATTSVVERRAFVVKSGSLYLAQSDKRWRGMWILPEVDLDGEPAHVETYPITRYRVRMEVVRAEPGGIAGLRAFPLDALEDVPIPSPHRRAIRALAGADAKRHRE
jgi:A/G-specific DNA glycosylase